MQQTGKPFKQHIALCDSKCNEHILWKHPMVNNVHVETKVKNQLQNAFFAISGRPGDSWKSEKSCSDCVRYHTGVSTTNP